MKLPAHLHLEKNNIPYEAKSFSPETKKSCTRLISEYYNFVIFNIELPVTEKRKEFPQAIFNTSVFFILNVIS